MTDEFLIKQYETMVKFWAEEGTRFWMCFQVFLAVNSGLLGIFPIVLDLLSDNVSKINFFSIMVLGWISVIGAVVAVTWLLLTVSGRGIQAHWKNEIQELEKNHEKVLMPPMNFDRKMNKWDFHMSSLAVPIPLSFIIIWFVIMITGSLIYFGIIKI